MAIDAAASEPVPRVARGAIIHPHTERACRWQIEEITSEYIHAVPAYTAVTCCPEFVRIALSEVASLTVYACRFDVDGVGEVDILGLPENKPASPAFYQT